MGDARVEALQELVRRDPLLGAEARAELLLAIEEPSRFTASPTLQALLGEVVQRGRGLDASRFAAEASEFLRPRAKILGPLSEPPSLAELKLPQDLHLRPAVALTQLAQEFPEARLSLQRAGEQLLLELNGLSGTELAGMWIPAGERIALAASGGDAAEVLEQAREILVGASPEVRIRDERGDGMLKALLFDAELMPSLHREFGVGEGAFVARSRAAYLDFDGGLLILGSTERVTHAQIDGALGLSELAGERLIAMANLLNETVEGSLKIEVPRLHPRNASGDERWERILKSVNEVFEPYARFVRRQEELLILEFSEELRPEGEGPVILDLTPGRPSFAGKEYDYRLELTAHREIRARDRYLVQQYARSIMPRTAMAFHTPANGIAELGRRHFPVRLEAGEPFTLLATGPDARTALRTVSGILSAGIAARAAFRVTSR